VVWSDETLDKFLAKPQTFMPGNTMPFPGMPRAEERAAVIIYLNNNTK
jgi:cytochrome c